MRFIYAASCVCCILDDWSGMDTDKVVEYIQKSQVSNNNTQQQQQQTDK